MNWNDENRYIYSLLLAYLSGAKRQIKINTIYVQTVCGICKNSKNNKVGNEGLWHSISNTLMHK